MKLHSEIERELKEISPAVAEIGNKNVFRTPAGFFGDLPYKILDRIHEQDSDTVIPANEEINQLSPLLAGIKNQSALSVPPGFFDQLPQTVSVKIAAEISSTPVISINSISKRRRALFAAAAAITGITMIGSLWFLFNNNRVSAPVAQNEGVQAVSTHLPGIADDELADYLSDVPATVELVSDNRDADYEQVAFFTLDDSNFSEMSSDISDETLNSYVKDNFGQTAL